MTPPTHAGARREMLHPALERQLEELGPELAEPAADAAPWRQLLERVSRSYADADEDRQLLERYRRLVQTAPEVIFSLSADGSTITSLNQAFERLTGWVCDAWLGKPLASLIHPRDLAHADQRIQQIRRGRSTPPFELRILTRGGGYLDAELTLTPLLEGERRGGTVCEILGIAHDVSDRKRVQQALRAAKEAAEAASHAKSDFLANMSHEIRTPLNAVIGLTSLLLDSRLDPQLESYVETIRASGDSVLALINDILDFSKIESGKMDLEEQPFRLEDCLAGPLDLVAAEAQSKGLELTSQVADGCPQVVIGDVARVQQILVNLLSNAVKFTDRGKVAVAVRCRPADGERLELETAVSDTGVGIPEGQMETIFQSFSQGDASTSRKYGGTGLGLAISRRLSELMGGRIWGESRPGEGSTFRFTIRVRPAAANEPTAPSARRTSGSSIDRRLGRRIPLRILVAEDNAVNQKVALLLLRRMGYRADLAADGEEAIACLERQRYDVLLMDVQMPVLDGIAATRLIRERWPGKEGPRIVAMTAGVMSGDRKRCFAAGMDDFVGKPVRIEELQAALERSGSGTAAADAEPQAGSREIPAPESGGGLKVRTDLELLGPKLLGEIIDKFVDNAQQQEAEIRRAIERGDCDKLMHAAHSLRGSSSTVGAARMAEICKELENGASRGSLDGAGERLRRLAAELERVVEFFRCRAASPAGESPP